MGGEERLTFNVGGKTYQTCVSTIEAQGNGFDLLNMLVRHRKEEEIFIDRDQDLFRWILHYYRTGVIVSCEVSGVAQEIWDGEIDFFGLIAPLPEKNGIVCNNPIEQKLIDQVNQRRAKLESEANSKEKKQKQDELNRIQEFQLQKEKCLSLLDSLFSLGTHIFVYAYSLVSFHHFLFFLIQISSQ